MSEEPKELTAEELKEEVSELLSILHNIDVQVGNALESVGRFPPKPAGFPDRIDILCRLVNDFHDENFAFRESIKALLELATENLISENEPAIKEARALIHNED